MAKTTRLPEFVGLLGILCAASAGALQAKEFSFSEKQNERLAKKLNIPIYFTLPASSPCTK